MTLDLTCPDCGASFVIIGSLDVEPRIPEHRVVARYFAHRGRLIPHEQGPRCVGSGRVTS